MKKLLCLNRKRHGLTGTLVCVFAALFLFGCSEELETSVPQESEKADADGMIALEKEVAARYYSDVPDSVETEEPTRVLTRGSSAPNNHLWMTFLRGDMLLTEMTFPGTHNSGADQGNAWAKCQDYGISEQLRIGIRALDVRCRHIGNSFAIHHNQVYMNKFFGEIRNACVDFLKQNPGETILMSIKEEHTATDNTRSFAETLRSYIQGFENYFYLTEKIPTLDEVRGKIVVLRRFSSSISPMGNKINVGNNTTSDSWSTLHARIQDYYDVPSAFDFNFKWSKISEFANEAQRSNDEKCLYINFLSGSGVGSQPWAVATGLMGSQGMSTRMKNFLQESGRIPGRYGIVFMDYAGSAEPLLVDRFVKANGCYIRDDNAPKVIACTSQEVNGEGLFNGRAVYAFDNNPNTFWHTEWYHKEPGLPQSVTFDLGRMQKVAGLKLQHRPNKREGRPRKYSVEYSQDGKKWATVPVPKWDPAYNASTAHLGVREMRLEDNSEMQYSFGSAVNARYMRLTIRSAEGNTSHTFLSEIKVFSKP